MKKKRNYFWKIMIGIVILIILGFLLYFNLRPFNIVIIGSDTRTNFEKETSGRADSITLVHISPKEGKVLILPFSRDTYLTINCTEQEDKVNHALRKGGIPCTINSLENYLNITINYYVFFTFETFKEAVDILGPLPIKSEGTFCQGKNESKFCFEKGVKYNMSGNMALAYARERKEDLDSYERPHRQQQILLASLSQMTMMKAFELRNMLKTNFKIFSITRALPLSFRRIDYSIDAPAGHLERRNETIYFILDEWKRQEIEEKFNSN